MSLCTKIEAWIKAIPWDAVTALATLAAVIIALITVREGSKDAKDNRDEQLEIARENQTNQTTRIQGTLMDLCIQEYFQIRRETAKDWCAATNATQTNIVKNLYSERMYGLHFEEYHLFRQNMIPTHIYTVWIKSLKNEVQRTNEEYYPQLDISKYIYDNPSEDFDVFIFQILGLKSDVEVEALVKKEADLPQYQ